MKDFSPGRHESLTEANTAISELKKAVIKAIIREFSKSPSLLELRMFKDSKLPVKDKYKTGKKAGIIYNSILGILFR